MSIALPSLTSRKEQVAVSRITFGRGPRVLVLPGKWQRIAAAVLINADYTVIEADMGSATPADVIVSTSPEVKVAKAISYTPDNVAAFLDDVANCDSVNRFSHIVSL